MKIPMKKPRKDYYTAITWIALIGTLIFRIFLVRIMGDKGIAYFSASNEIYLAVAGSLPMDCRKLSQLLSDIASGEDS